MAQGHTHVRPRIPVLLYHRIDVEAEREWRPFCVAPEDFAAQMAWLAGQGYATISLGQLWDYYHVAAPAPEKPVVITFDDGYYCNYSRAFPILQRHGFAATVFLLHNSVRNHELAPREGRQCFMSWAEILEMQAAGWEFHSHGLDHRKMTILTKEELAQEVCASRALLAERLGRPVDFFCYPFGAFDAGVQEVVRACGYRGACGGLQDKEEALPDDYAIGRTEILWGESLRQFSFKLQHGLSYYFYTKKKLGRLKRRFVNS